MVLRQRRAGRPVGRRNQLRAALALDVEGVASRACARAAGNRAQRADTAEAAGPTAGAPNAWSSARWVSRGQEFVETDPGETSGRLPIFVRDTEPLRNV